MRRWRFRLHSLPLRLKLGVTLVGGALAVLGASTFFSFRYWKGEALVIAEQQALLAGGAVRGTVEAAIATGQPVQARRALRRLVQRGTITSARVYAPDGRILISSSPDEEGTRAQRQWLPGRDALGPDGIARFDPATETVEAFVPLVRSDAPLLHVSFPVGPVRTAMDRGLKTGIALVVASLIAFGVLVSTMVEREVVAPVRQVSGLLDPGAARTRAGTDEIRGLAWSVVRLLEKERAVEELAAQQRVQIEAQAGLAQVGELAAEMAHEFKRPLTSIRTALDVIDQEYALDDRGEHLLGSVQQQLDKLSETMRDLFAIARPVELERETVEVKKVVDAALIQLAAHPALRGVEVRREYAGETAVRGDPQRLEQLLLNLALNAAEAMPEDGTLTLRVRGRAAGWWWRWRTPAWGSPPTRSRRCSFPSTPPSPPAPGWGWRWRRGSSRRTREP